MKFISISFANAVTSMIMYKIFVDKKSCIMCIWTLIRLKRIYKIFWLIHCNLFFIFRTCRIIYNIFLMTLSKSVLMFTFSCKSIISMTLYINIKEFKRNDLWININLTFYNDLMMNLFTKASFKRINFAQKMSDLKFILIIILRIATLKNAYLSN